MSFNLQKKTDTVPSSFKDQFFKHEEEESLFAYGNMYAYRYDKHSLQLLEQMPCRFSCSFYGANWYPTLEIQESFYGIYQKTLY